jgi:hypothetical protein
VSNFGIKGRYMEKIKVLKFLARAIFLGKNLFLEGI